MEWILEFLNNERSLFLFAGILGIISFVVGLLFLLFANHNSFAITMMLIGVLEMAVMFPNYIKYQKKIDAKISIYKSDVNEFVKMETITTKKALKSFFKLKLIYGILTVILILAMSFLDPKSVLFGIFTVFILHFSFAITIDNFGEKYTKKYLTNLQLENNETTI